MITFDDSQMKKNLQSLREQEEEQLVKRAASNRGIPYIDLTKVIVSTDALSMIEEERARKENVAAFKITGDQVHLVALSERDNGVRAIVQELKDKDYGVIVYLGSQKSLNKAWDRYEDIRKTMGSKRGFIDIADESLRTIVEQVHTKDDIKRLFETIADEEENKRTSRLVEIIMGSAIATKTSDIHIEPQEEEVRLRFRQDGILEDVLFFEHATYKQLNSRIKLLSHMKLNVTNNAQDGRFTIDYNGVEIEMRVSTVPGPYGEGIVMRVLDPAGINVGLEELGMEPFLLETLKKEVEKPNGLILNTGPTGSGKTTTLYSLLKYIYDPEIKILTIEDPIEYHLKGIHQTQVEHSQGYDFESGLRAAMRQDPDVILVGEIRDHETALAAMQASQTGHLVFSTLHTNTAAGAVPRLLDLGINHATLAQSMTVALAQRLVRKLTDAKKKVRATREQEAVMRAVLRNAVKNGKDLSRFEGINPDMEMWVWEPVPNKKSESGYKGRMGIFEMILIDKSVKEILDQKPTDRQVKEVAQQQGLLTIAEDGVIKILQGRTSYEEVARVVDLEEDVKQEIAAILDADEEQQQVVVTSGGTKSAQHTAQPVDDLVSQVRENLADEQSHTQPTPQPGSGTTSLASHEINLLVDYLKMLENHQREYPAESAEQKIGDVQNTIIELLKNHNPNDLFTQRDNERRVQQEIDLLIGDLDRLRQHQVANPDIGVADKLHSIRSSLEALATS